MAPKFAEVKPFCPIKQYRISKVERGGSVLPESFMEGIISIDAATGLLSVDSFAEIVYLSDIFV